MRISEAGLDLIRRFEGLRLNAYRCAAGVWTIGYGHTAGVKQGQKISKAQAEAFLREDIARFERAVNGLNRPWSQGQFDALVSFAFNCGEGNLSRLCAGRSAEVISKKMLLYHKAGGRVNQGLVERRSAEQALFLRDTERKSECPYTVPKKSVTSGDNGRRCGCTDFITAGEGVRWVQWQLNRAMGCGLMVDGLCGVKTEAAIRAFQTDRGLSVDGICGKKTRAALAQ